MNKKTIIVTVLLLLLAACQTRMFPIGMVEEPQDNPEYTVEADLNG